jgi:flagellar hook protein FlgE
MQVGSGVITSSVKNIFTQGALNRTGVGTDMAIDGDGFFVVRDPVSQTEYVTRAGDFRLDNNGYLVTNKGLRVQGFNAASNSAGAAQGDIQINVGGFAPSTSTPGATMTTFAIAEDGTINVHLNDGSIFMRAQLLLQRFSDPQALLKEGDNLYSGIAAAGPLGGSTPLAGQPGTSGLGGIASSALELSNVDLANEFANLIATQRGFQASARIITTSDEILQELVNLKR